MQERVAAVWSTYWTRPNNVIFGIGVLVILVLTPVFPSMAMVLLLAGMVISEQVRIGLQMSVGLAISGVIAAVIGMVMLSDGRPGDVWEPPLWLLVAGSLTMSVVGLVLTGVARRLWLGKELT